MRITKEQMRKIIFEEVTKMLEREVPMEYTPEPQECDDVEDPEEREMCLAAVRLDQGEDEYNRYLMRSSGREI